MEEKNNSNIQLGGRGIHGVYKATNITGGPHPGFALRREVVQDLWRSAGGKEAKGLLSSRGVLREWVRTWDLTIENCDLMGFNH